MIEIIKILVEFGMSFEYEHNGSQGESVRCYEMDLTIRNSEGKIRLTHEGDTEVFDEHYTYVASLVHKLCVDETSSF